jgi:hypothetical protein
MPGREAKFCTDRNQVRWVLLEGVINRKTQQDDPDKGLNLPVEKIQRIEQTVIERRHKSPVAKPAMLFGIVLLALFGWVATSHLWVGVPGLVIGAIVLFWGLARISGTVEKLDSFQIVVPGMNPQELLVIGSHLEVTGFIEGVRKEVEQAQRQQAASRN